MKHSLLFLPLLLWVPACDSDTATTTAALTDNDVVSAGDQDTRQEEPAPPGVFTTAEVAAAGPFEVSDQIVTFIDDTRSTPAYNTYTGAESRTLKTRIWAPVGNGPFPLVIYSHGFMSLQQENEVLCGYLATHGIVVAAANYPLTSVDAPDGPTLLDLLNMPGDVSYLIDQLLLGDYNVDPERIAVGGMSLGGLTSFLVGKHPAFKDKRVKATVSMAGPLCFMPDKHYADDGNPLLLIYGTGDVVAPYTENGVRAFEAAPHPTTFVTVADASHTGFVSYTAETFAENPNPDAVGCIVLRTRLESSGLENITEEMGLSEDSINQDCPVPCDGELPENTLSSLRQAELVPLTFGVFMRAVLFDDPALWLYLHTTVAAENPEVSVQASAAPGSSPTD